MEVIYSTISVLIVGCVLYLVRVMWKIGNDTHLTTHQYWDECLPSIRQQENNWNEGQG